MEKKLNDKEERPPLEAEFLTARMRGPGLPQRASGGVGEADAAGFIPADLDRQTHPGAGGLSMDVHL